MNTPLPSPSDLFADMLTAKGLIGGFGLGVSVLIGVVYLLFLRIPGVLFLLIWGLLFAVWAILAGAGAMLFQTADAWAAEPEPRVHDDGQINAAKYLSYVMFGEGRWDAMSGFGGLCADGGGGGGGVARRWQPLAVKYSHGSPFSVLELWTRRR